MFRDTASYRKGEHFHLDRNIQVYVRTNDYYREPAEYVCKKGLIN
ncbi:hypothetical protein LM600918_10116 [Listeria monocytogenes]|nr:hypothetical protein LM600444_10151 [Listeria monocytogenes]CUK58323.1 hypothetical protein LM600918_10116 [Listeria monocytogenes]CUK74185.1 hypothetical protein LM601598_10153 [Listeria monocytogenes]CUK90581.1 hypothetical protein LM701042_10151 [Listeria monocytogenes]